MRSLLLLSLFIPSASADWGDAHDDDHDECVVGTVRVVASFSNDNAPEEMELLDENTLLATKNAEFQQAGREPSAAVLIDRWSGEMTELPVEGQNLALEHAAVGAKVLDEDHFVVALTQGPTTGGPELVEYTRACGDSWSQSYFSSYPGSPYTDIVNGVEALPGGHGSDTVLFTDAVHNIIYASPPGGGGPGTAWLDATGRFPPIFPGQQMGLNAMQVQDGYVYVTFTGGPHPVDPLGNPLPPPFDDVDGGLYRVPIDNPSVANLELVYDFGLAMPDGVFSDGDDLYVTLANPDPSFANRVVRVDNIDGAGGATVTTFYQNPELVMPANGTVADGEIYVVGHDILNVPTPSGNNSNVLAFCIGDDDQHGHHGHHGHP